ncbi:MAG TPA: hypothetical protein VLX68_17300, partial [Chitinivibrionales bacterium]|nr:hypothetical protein [Chitinivibrionales bacterium]
RTIYQKANWDIDEPATRAPMIFGGVIGLQYFSTDETGQLIKQAVEKNTSYKVAEINPQHRRLGNKPVLIIGAKPLLAPLPPNVKKEVEELADKLQELSNQILTFAADRQQAEALMRENSKKDDQYENWQRSVAFSNQTRVWTHNLIQ